MDIAYINFIYSFLSMTVTEYVHNHLLLFIWKSSAMSTSALHKKTWNSLKFMLTYVAIRRSIAWGICAYFIVMTHSQNDFRSYDSTFEKSPHVSKESKAFVGCKSFTYLNTLSTDYYMKKRYCIYPKTNMNGNWNGYSIIVAIKWESSKMLVGGTL